MTIKKSICLFCSLGCGIAFKTKGENVLSIVYDKDNPINLGALCPRGHYNLELINHPQRLSSPQLKGKSAAWTQALTILYDRLQQTRPEELAILLSANISNEEACLACQLANKLNTKNIGLMATPSDLESLSSLIWQGETGPLENILEIGQRESLLIIGDLLTRSPVLSKRVNQVKYAKRGNRIFVIDPERTHTAWFATDHLQNQPGTETVLLAAMVAEAKNLPFDFEKAAMLCGISVDKIKQAVQAFNAAASGSILFVPGEDKFRNDLINYFIRILAGTSAHKNWLTLYTYGNLLGTYHILSKMVPDRISKSALTQKIAQREIKTLLMLGDCQPDLDGVEFSVSSCFFSPGQEPSLLLPLAGHLEEEGSFTPADMRTERHAAVVHPVNSWSNFNLLSNLLGERKNFDEIHGLVKYILNQPLITEPVDLQNKLNETVGVEDIQPLLRQNTLVENITHFGDNTLVKNFFWFRANN